MILFFTFFFSLSFLDSAILFDVHTRNATQIRTLNQYDSIRIFDYTKKARQNGRTNGIWTAESISVINRNKYKWFVLIEKLRKTNIEMIIAIDVYVPRHPYFIPIFLLLLLFVLRFHLLLHLCSYIFWIIIIYSILKPAQKAEREISLFAFFLITCGVTKMLYHLQSL